MAKNINTHVTRILIPSPPFCMPLSLLFQCPSLSLSHLFVMPSVQFKTQNTLKIFTFIVNNEGIFNLQDRRGLLMNTFSVMTRYIIYSLLKLICSLFFGGDGGGAGCNLFWLFFCCPKKTFMNVFSFYKFSYVSCFFP